MTTLSRILVVDDDRHVRDMLDLILRTGQFTDIVSIGSAEEALDLLDIDSAGATRPARFDLIVLDINMPGIDGIETCARIRSSRSYRDTPILVISGLQETELLNQAFFAGAHDFLPKPINRLEFLARIRSALRFKRELDRRRRIEDKLLHINSSLQGELDGHPAGLVPGLASPRTFRLLLQEAAQSGLSCGVIGASTGTPGQDGDALAERLAHLEAPLGWALAAYGDGRFFVLAPRASDTQLRGFVERLRDHAGTNVSPAGGWDGSGGEQVVETVTGEAAGPELLALPSELTAALDRRLALRQTATTPGEPVQ